VRLAWIKKNNKDTKSLYMRFWYNDMICLKKKFQGRAFLFAFFVVDFGAVHWKEPGGLIWHTLVRNPGYGMAMVRRKVPRMVVYTTETNVSMIEVRGVLEWDEESKG